MVDLDAGAVAELQAFVAQIEAQSAALPSAHTFPVELQRQLMASGAEPPAADARDEVIAGIPVRVFEPASTVGTYLHLHGGGWTMGGNAQQDQRLLRIATEARARVVSVEYRLAPEHPFPACIDDCLAVAEVVSQGGPVVVGGESAGAHLSALLLTRHRAGMVGAVLSYGCYDLGMSASQRAWEDRSVILSTPIIRWHLDQLLPGVDEAGRRDPAVSPLFADLDGVPPALLTIGTEDPMLDDSLDLARRWPGATLDRYEGGFHAFDLMPLQAAETATRRQVAFIVDRLTAP